MAFFDQHASFDQAASYYRAGDLDRAESLCKQLLRRNKRDADAIHLCGAIAMKRRNHAEAAKHFARCVALQPREARYHALAGQVAAMQGRYREAIRMLDKALLLAPGYEPAVEYKATVLVWDGKYEQARTVLAPFVGEHRDNVGMAEAQARIDLHDQRYREAAEILARHLAEPDLPPETRHRIGHVEGSAYEKLGEYEKSFEAHTAANQAVAVGFDPVAYAQMFDRIIEVFSGEFIATSGRHGNRSELPVFIAGMPRSGTTLVEQIIDAHPKAHGAGELEDVERMVAGLQVELDSTDAYPDCAADLEADDVARLAKRYHEGLRRHSRSAKRIVNKSLENYKNVGFIASLFPAARIIHCRRDPRDTCVSCYMSGLQPRLLPFVSNLRDLGYAYCQYERLVDHWRNALPVPMLEVEYEALVDDLEGGTRRIIEFCGLEFDERCLAFYASGRTVRTASYDQVRRPIYRSSIGRYQRFEGQLGPLIDALDAGCG